MPIRDYDTKDTIAAIATFPSAAALGVIKISGKKAVSIARRIFLPKDKKKDIEKAKSYTLHYGWIIQPSGKGKEIIDEVLVSVMRAPYSYTREDVIEISSHGGILILNKILKLVLKSGARLAKPGEFSYRAFLNGRLDIIQLQAIADIIETKTEKALFSLSRQLRGDFSKTILAVKNEIKDVNSMLEACINFPEEDVKEDLPQAKRKIKKVREGIKKVLDNYSVSRILHEGARCVICGPANAGKSTLFNRILKRERSIVTRIPGTTRDTIEETVTLKGVPLRIYDTAGIIEADDFISRSAVRKSYEAVEKADLVVFMFDSSRPVSREDLSLLDRIKDKNIIILINKIDLSCRINEIQLKSLNKPLVKISALKNIGIDKLENAVFDAVYTKGIGREDNIVVLAEWQAQVLRSILFHLDEAERFINEGFTLDFVTLALNGAFDELSKLSGDKADENILNSIFSRFCIGK